MYKLVNYKKIISILMVLAIIGGFLSACNKSDQVSTKEPEMTSLEDKLYQSLDMSEMVKLDEAKFQRIYDINPDDLEEFFVYISSSNIKAAELVVLKVKDSTNVDSIKEKLAQRVDEQANSFKDYLPDEYYLLENHVLKVKNNYLLLAVSKNVEEIEKIFDQSFE